MLDETQEGVERRQDVDAQLASYVMPIDAGDRSQRDQLAATWGRRAMRRAIDAGGPDNRAGR
jgi:hypothetical protein